MCHINAKLRELWQDFGVSAVLMFDPLLTVFMKFCAIHIANEHQQNIRLEIVYLFSLSLSLSHSLSTLL